MKQPNYGRLSLEVSLQTYESKEIADRNARHQGSWDLKNSNSLKSSFAWGSFEKSLSSDLLKLVDQFLVTLGLRQSSLHYLQPLIFSAKFDFFP